MPEGGDHDREGIRHPVTGPATRWNHLAVAANIYLSAIDERYRRWTIASRERPQNAADRQFYDRSRGPPTFQVFRYADDFVILVSGGFRYHIGAALTVKDVAPTFSESGYGEFQHGKADRLWPAL